MQYLDRAIEAAKPFAPVAGLIGGFITVDWLEKKVRTPGGTTAETKKWWMPGSAVPQPGGVDDTWIGPIAAGALRAGLILAFAAQSAEGLSALMNLNPFD